MTPQLLIACAAALGMTDAQIAGQFRSLFRHGTGFRSYHEERRFVDRLDELVPDAPTTASDTPWAQRSWANQRRQSA